MAKEPNTVLKTILTIIAFIIGFGFGFAAITYFLN